MQTDTQNELDNQERIKDFEGFCDFEEKNEGGQNHSTEDESNTLQKKRKRETDEDEKEDKKEENICIKLVNENIILYSDSENDKSLKEDSSSNSEENEKYDNYSDYNDQQEQKKEENGDNFEGLDYDLSCNDNN
jgi:hypothetical protein